MILWTGCKWMMMRCWNRFISRKSKEILTYSMRLTRILYTRQITMELTNENINNYISEMNEFILNEYDYQDNTDVSWMDIEEYITNLWI